MYLFKAKQAAAAELERAYVEQGVTKEQVAEFLAAHPEFTSSLHKAPHVRGHRRRLGGRDAPLIKLSRTERLRARLLGAAKKTQTPSRARRTSSSSSSRRQGTGPRPREPREGGPQHPSRRAPQQEAPPSPRTSPPPRSEARRDFHKKTGRQEGSWGSSTRPRLLLFQSSVLFANSLSRSVAVGVSSGASVAASVDASTCRCRHARVGRVAAAEHGGDRRVQILERRRVQVARIGDVACVGEIAHGFLFVRARARRRRVGALLVGREVGARAVVRAGLVFALAGFPSFRAAARVARRRPTRGRCSRRCWRRRRCSGPR